MGRSGHSSIDTSARVDRGCRLVPLRWSVAFYDPPSPRTLPNEGLRRKWKKLGVRGPLLTRIINSCRTLFFAVFWYRMSSVCSSLRMRFSTRCLYHGIYGSFGHQTDEILEELLFIAFVMWKVIEKMTIVNRKFDMYMVSRFDWSISILFSLAGTYASIDVNRGS